MKLSLMLVLLLVLATHCCQIKLYVGFQGWIWGVAWGPKHPPPNFYYAQAWKLLEAVVQVLLHLYKCLGNDRCMKEQRE